MLLPSIFGDNFFDDFMDFPSRRMEQDFTNLGALMKTDVKELEDGYEVAIDLPGFKKEDVKAKLKDGYMTVTATRSTEDEGESGKYLRRERYMGTVSRSFFVGRAITEEDIKARFENGILTIGLPKKEVRKADTERYISIEG